MDEKNERVKFQAKLAPDLHRWLKVAAAERGTDMNALLGEALLWYRKTAPGVRRGLDLSVLNETERAVWRKWHMLSRNEPSPVKRIARSLRMAPADVAFIVYPAETFGRWDDSQEPDLS